MPTPASPERPIYECVKPIDRHGKRPWSNRYSSEKVTPSIPDSPDGSRPPSWLTRFRDYMQDLRAEFNSPLSEAAEAIRHRPPC